MERVVGNTLLGRPGAECLHPPSLYMTPISVVGLTALVLEGLFGGCRLSGFSVEGIKHM